METGETFILLVRKTSCDGLESVVICEGVTSIGASAFERCRGLRSVTIPSSETSIGDDAFSGCDRLVQVTIPASVQSLGRAAFAECERLRAVCFCGDKPECCEDIYGYGTDSVTTYVRKEANGWDEVPGEWCGRPIELWENYPDGFGCVMRTEIDGRSWLYCAVDDGVGGKGGGDGGQVAGDELKAVVVDEVGIVSGLGVRARELKLRHWWEVRHRGVGRHVRVRLCLLP